MQDERSSRTQRRILVLGLCLSYLGFLVTLWYIWNAPRQGFDTFWLHISANRFTLLLIPLLVFSVCYFKLCCLAGDMLKMRDRQLDERQRMVRDSAHRTAYKIVMLLCLLIPLYLAAQGFFGTPSTSSTTDVITIKPPVVSHITIIPANPRVPINLSMVLKYDLSADSHLQVRFANSWNAIVFSRQIRPATIAPIISSPINQGVYYSLVLFALLLIIATLPKAIIAWKEF